MIEHGVIIVCSLLVIALISSIILKKIRFPYTIGLVVIGGTLGLLANQVESLGNLRHLELSPDIILFLILPTLIFDAAINIKIKLLLRNIVPILLLACFGIIISSFVIGGTLSLFSPLSLSGALLFGALISATDPVAVIALFNEIKAPKRLVTLIDGESIFNDATAIVLFSIFLTTPFSKFGDITQNALPGILSFFTVLSGGVVVGGIIGVLGSLMLHIKKGDMILQFTVTLTTAYISFILADRLHASGVISTLCAGLVFSATSEYTIRRRHRESIHHFWEYFTFTANSFVFLLLGFTELSIFHTKESIRHSIWIILLSIPVILLGRACVIYAVIPFYNRFTSKSNKISASYQAILLWGGLRGAVPVALVFSIPEDFPNRIIILHLTFSFILFTLLFQGTSIKFLMNCLGINPEKNELEGVKDLTHARHSFKNEYLAGLVIKGLLEIFSEEGFFVSKNGKIEKASSYLAKKREIIVIITQEEESISLTHRKTYTKYINTVLYETLLEFDKSLKAIEEIVRPEDFASLIKIDDASEDDFATSEPNICKYIEGEQIVNEIQNSEKEAVIRELLQVLWDNGKIPDFDEALKALFEREKTMTTGIGEGIALPHAKIKGINRIHAVLGVSRNGIEFNSMDGEKVTIVVLILSPASAPLPHIQFMASISKLLNSSQIRDKILSSDTNGICEIIKKHI